MKVTIKIIQEINRLYEEDNKISYIANKLGLSDGTIRNYIWKPRTKAILTELKKKEVNNLYSAGKSMEKIADELNLSYYVVIKNIEKTRHKGNKKSLEQINKINELSKSGMVQRQICEKLGFSMSTVNKYIENPAPMGRRIKESV